MEEKIKSDHKCECECGEYTYISTHSDKRSGIKKGEAYRFLPGHNSRVTKNKEKLKINMEKARFFQKEKYEKEFPVNESIFLREDAFSFYLLGCYSSDGNVHKPEHGSLRCSLYSNNYEWLCGIRDILIPGSTVRKENGTNMYTLGKRSDTFGNWLISHGCVPNKSLIMSLSEKIPDEYFRDFARGIIDGDGSVMLLGQTGTKIDKKYKYLYPYVQICSGSVEFLKELIHKFESLGFKFSFRTVKKKANKYIKKDGIAHYCYICNYPAVEFLRWLYYSDDIFCLGYKKENANKIFELYKSKRNMSALRENKIKCIELKKQGLTNREIADKLGIDRVQVKNFTKGVKNSLDT